MTRSCIRRITTTVCSALGLFLLLSPAAAQGRGTPSTAPLGTLNCTVFGPDRVCASEGAVQYLAQVQPNPPGTTYAWTLHTNTTDGCPGTGTTTPTFCGPTDQPTVCINPGLNPGRFVVKVVITNAFATSTCCLSVNVRPTTFTTTPPPASVCPGMTHTFCTTASGGGPYTYSWAKNGAVIPGATDSCYTATAGPAGSVDSYCVTTTGSGMCALSYTACGILTSLPVTTVAALPSPRRCEGQTFAFCATVNGTGPFTYSWTKNGVGIPGATDDCYTATTGAPGTVDSYCITVTGACGPPVERCGTLTARLNTVTTDLTNASACQGLTHQFCTTASGTGPFTYSWTKNGAAIPGATDSCYTATAGAGGTVDTYCVTAAGACGEDSSCATLTSNANVTATEVQGATVCAGTTHQFCTTAGGTGPFSYQWTKNAAPIAGATDSCYTATAGASGVVDTYCVTVTGACGPPVQRCASLTASNDATATPLGDATKCPGLTHQFCTTAGGTGPFTYSWTKNAAAIPGATDSCYTATANPIGGSVDTYCVTVVGLCGTVQRCGTLTSLFNVTATEVENATVCEGLTWQFCTTAGGTGPFTYSWTKNGAGIPGATASCYTATAGLSGTVDTYCVTVSGACGAPVQRCANLTATTNVSATPLTSATKCPGQTHQFCTTAGGTGPFTYSWTKNAAPIPGATDSCYTATASSTGGAVDSYCVTVVGACGNIQRCATLTSNFNVTATEVQNATVCEGLTWQFCTTAGGTGPFTYSWTKNGAAIPGATDSCYTATAGPGGSVDTYCVTVGGACGNPVQRCATLTANTNVTATALTGATKCPGQTHQMCTVAGGTGPFTYSWTKNAVPIPGATDSCYTATAGAGGAVDVYCVTVVGACGNIERCATITSNFNVTATEVQSATACEGFTHQFCTTAGGTGPFTYSWTKNAVPIAGATDSCYTATAGLGGAIDTYCVTVSGACGAPVVRCATLTATNNVTATALNNATKCAGLTHQFCTVAGGTGPFTYSWTKNAVPIPGATDSCYTATAGPGGTVDSYCVTVTGACGNTQRCATLTSSFDVTATEVQGATVCAGATHQFCTTAGGTGPFTYSWTKNAAVIPGATDSCYTATAGLSGTVDTYCVTVSGACGPPVQRCASLTAINDVGATPLGNATKCEGLTHQFCTTASGTGPFTYSWTKNAAAIPGATGSCYTATAGVGGTVDTYCVTVAGACGSIQRCGTLTANANTVATPLTPATVCVSSTHQFCTTASGTGPFTYVWKKNGNTISGATNSCYTATASSTAGNVHTYCVIVTGVCGPPVERCATLTASGNTTATQLDDASVCAGATHQFCTTAGGAGPFTYSWTKNGNTIPGATNSCYTATAGSAGTAATYCVTVTGACGTKTKCAVLCATSNVHTTDLCPATVCAGATNQFCTTTTGTGPFTYVWKKNGNTIPGATGSCYTATAGSNGTVDTYCVTATGSCGSDSECATLTAAGSVSATPLTNANRCPGSTHQFCTTASGSGPFTYVWRKNGNVISGATNSCYTATASSTGGTVHTYCVTVTGSCGSVERCATLTAKLPTTATPLSDATGCYGSTHQFCTTAGGTGPFTYSWKKDGNTIAGATNSCYTATVGSNPHTYCVTVTGACGSVTRCAVLCKSSSVSATDLCDESGCVGEPVSFWTTASGTGPFTYKWYRNGNLVSGATSSSYSFDLAAGDDEVCVTVTGACGSCVTRCADICVQSCGARHLTLTQGAYGNSGGQLNGVGRLALIQMLLDGDMRVGVLNTRSLKFREGAHDAQCIIDRMPSGGSAASLPNFGNETLDSDCQTSPTAIPLQNGRFQNILLGQVTALSLNVRLSDGIDFPNGCDTIDTNLWSQEICRTMVSRRLLNGPDGCIGTADDVPDLGAPLVTVTISSSVMTALSNLSLPQTVGGLLSLGNRALAGQSTGGASLSNISSAVDAINILYDEGRELMSCTNP